MPYLFNFAVR